MKLDVVREGTRRLCGLSEEVQRGSPETASHASATQPNLFRIWQETFASTLTTETQTTSSAVP